MIIIQLAEKGTGVHYNQLWDVRENDFYSQPLKIGNAKKQKKFIMTANRKVKSFTAVYRTRHSFCLFKVENMYKTMKVNSDLLTTNLHNKI